MNHHQWSQRLRGHINLKLCIGLGGIALAGAFVVNLPAQDKTASSSTKACCGESQATSSNPLPPLITEGIKKARLANAGRRVAKQIIPNGINVTGTISGPFAQKDSTQFEPQTLSFAEANQRLFQLDAVYDVTIDLKSQKRNVYEVSLQTGQSLASHAKPIVVNSLGVSADTAMQNLRLSGATTGEFLAHNGVSWKVTTHPVSEETVAYPGQTDVKHGVKTQGTIRGLFVNFANDKLERSTQDITDTSGFGPTGSPYEIDVKLAHSRAVLQGAVLGNAARKEPLLQIITDVPVKSFRLRGIIDGTRFGSGGLAWGVATADDVKQMKNVAMNSQSQPARLIPADFSEDSVSPRSLLFVPEEHQQLLLTPVGFLHDVFNGIGDILKGRIGDLFKGNEAVGSNVEGDVYEDKSETKDTGPFDGCPSKYDARTSGEKEGYVITSTSDNQAAGASVLNDWKAQFNPLSEGLQYYPDPKAPYYIEGSKNVTVHWGRTVGGANKTVSILYARSGTKSPITKTVKYHIVVKQYLAWYVLNQTGATPCPTPTATPDPEDGQHNATPVPKAPMLNGNTTPVAPTPVAQP